MPVAKAPVFVMNENFTITATCPNSYMAFINGEEKTLPYTVTQTYQQQIIVVKGYGYGEGMQNSDTVEQTFSVPAMEMPKAEAPVFAMNESFEITATCANSYKAYVNDIETVLPYTVTQTYQQQNIVVSGYGYGINLQNSDTVEQSFVVPAKHFDEYVDLGLPSGTLWATRNIGANSPVEYYGYNGFTDNKRKLDPEDDAAYVNWGSSWRMPTKKQQNELRDKCTWTWTTLDGVNGRLVTGPNGNTIFLPAAGECSDSGLRHDGSWGYYWSSELYFYTDGSDVAQELHFYSGYFDTGWDLRYYGLTVRAVRVPQN